MSQSRRIAIALRIDQPYPNHQDVFGGVRRYAREHGDWQCVIDEHPGYASACRGRPVDDYDGVIARAQPPMQRRLRQRGIPLVNTIYVFARPDVAGVYLDVEQCGRIAAEHLMERGFRRLVYLDVGSYRQARDIGSAFAATVAEHGHTCTTEQLGAGAYEDRRYWQAMRKHIGQFLDTLTPPVGFLTGMPWVARLLAGLCEQRGWRVPQQVALISVDDHKNVTELPPQISCIDCNYEAVGYEAAALLQRIIAGDAPPHTHVVVPPRGIITRESTDYFAVDDDVVAQALRFIAKNLGQKLTLGRIADQVAVSPRSLQRRFDRALGRAVSDEIRRLRLEMAKRMLGEKGLSINRIAQVSGFTSSIILGQVFRRELGTTPTGYRKRMLNP